MSYEQMLADLNEHEREYRQCRDEFASDGIDAREQAYLDQIEDVIQQLRDQVQRMEREGVCAPDSVPQGQSQEQRPATAPSPTVPASRRRRDISQIMSLVQEFHVSGSDERQIVQIFQYHAQDPASFEEFLRELTSRHFWSGVVGEQFNPLLGAVLNELEGENAAAVRRLLQSSSRQDIREYQPPEEVTFRGSFWQDLSEGQIRDQIFASFRGMGDAGVAIAESVVLLITRPEEFVQGIARLPKTVRMFWQNREQLRRDFLAAKPEDQARVIGRIAAEVALLRATAEIGGSGGAGRAPALAPATAVVGGRAALQAESAAISAAQLGQAGALTMQAAVVASQTQGAGQAGQEALESNASTHAGEASSSAAEGGNAAAHADDSSSLASHADDADWSEVNQAVGLDEPSTGPRRPNIRQAVNDAHEAGLHRSTDAAVQPYGRARPTRSALEVTGREAEAAHIGPTAFLKGLLNYSRRQATTLLLDPVIHDAFDKHWMDWVRARRRAGQVDASTTEIYEMMKEAIDQTPTDARTRAVMTDLLRNEFWQELGVSQSARLPLPEL